MDSVRLLQRLREWGACCVVALLCPQGAIAAGMETDSAYDTHVASSPRAFSIRPGIDDFVDHDETPDRENSVHAGNSEADADGRAPAERMKAEEAENSGLLSAFRDRFQIQNQWLTYGTFTDLTSSSDFNPGNQFAREPKRQLNNEARLDINGKVGSCRVNARLRGHYDRYVSGDPIDHRSNTDFFLNTGGVVCFFGSRFSLGAGREVPQWGSAFYASPSNPFFFDTGKTEPIKELYGKDIWTASIYPGERTTISLMHNYRAGSREPMKAHFPKTTSIKADWIGNVANGGVVLSHSSNDVKRLGFYGTYVYSDAWIFYADMAAGKGRKGYFAKRDGHGLSWHFEQNRRKKDWFGTALLGGAYTFMSGWTATAEWLTGNEGYNRHERAAYDAAVKEAARAFYRGGSGAAEAAGVIGSALTAQTPYLGRNIIFLQLANTEWANKADVAVRLAKSLSPGSGASLKFSLTYFLSDNLQAFATGVHNFGSDDADFSRIVRTSVSTGLRFYF